MFPSDGGKPAGKPVRYVARDGSLDFLATQEESPPLCGSRVKIGGQVYLVTAVVQYEEEFKVWVRKEIIDVMGA